jgi:uncharacterized protein YcaQ
VLPVLQRLGSIHFGPIAVAGRIDDLMLHARVAGYEPAWCDELSARGEIFETTKQGALLHPDERGAVVPCERRSQGTEVPPRRARRQRSFITTADYVRSASACSSARRSATLFWTT